MMRRLRASHRRMQDSQLPNYREYRVSFKDKAVTHLLIIYIWHVLRKHDFTNPLKSRDTDVPFPM